MKLIKFIAIALAFLFVVSGCSSVGVHATAPPHQHKPEKYKKGGPPPHAPAHGYRHKHKGHDMDYDMKIGAYIVVRVPDTYFYDNLFIRLFSDGRWMVSAHLNSGWRLADANEVPPRLKHHKEYEYSKKNKHKHKKKQ